MLDEYQIRPEAKSGGAGGLHWSNVGTNGVHKIDSEQFMFSPQKVGLVI